MYNKVYEDFICAVDAGDNGINAYPEDIEPLYHDGTALHSRVKALNPRWNQPNTDAERYSQFLKYLYAWLDVTHLEQLIWFVQNFMILW